MTTTSKEFVLWAEWLKQKKEKDITEHGKMDYYMAQIAAEVRRSFVKHPNKVRAKDFLMKFELKNPVSKNEENVDKMARSKTFWSMLLSGRKA